MLLIHQAGSVKIGEVVRYTITYTPSDDRILPTPTHLHLRVKNSTAIALRAAWIHGPYALHVSAYSSNFNPHRKVEKPDHDGVPEYEPMVKAGGSWSAKLLIPKDIRETGADFARRRSSQVDPGERKEKGRVTWIVEITSQILFSNSASVDFEVLVGRDQRSLELGFAALAGHGHGGPGRVKDLQGDRERKEARRRGHVQVEGVFSRAVRLVVEDTETLWDKPALPTWEDANNSESRTSTHHKRQSEDTSGKEHEKDGKQKKRRNVHLVVLTHGLHSNLGADMLFLKESIDATVAQARVDARKRKVSYRAQQKAKQSDKTSQETKAAKDEPSNVDEKETSAAPMSGGQEELDNAPDQDEDDDEEETIVRGFNGNAVRTENGIQYLGKRLAKYILRFTYPDQPFLPIKKSLTRKVTDTFTTDADKARRDGKPTHHGSSIHTPREARKAEDLPYRFTSISFIGHSLGGLIQTYAIAYIHKHSPTFFDQIKPVNFICMASPMLGLSNENPMYVKFALDFGLVGRTGQDLGLTWRPPTLANKGWNAMVNGFGAGSQKTQEARQADPSAKPLLRILPTGPAHHVLRMFRNRTVYSNVVNDGIVPLRTSCLLFLDWRGLGKVEKARRENGLIGTVAEWGWAELTGANSSSVKPNVLAEQSWETDDEDNTQVGDDVPQPAEDEVAQDNRRTTARMSHDDGDDEDTSRQGSSHSSLNKAPQPEENKGMLASFFSFFTPERAKTPPPPSKKTTKILRRGQTVYQPSEDESSDNVAKDKSGSTSSNPTMRPHLTHSLSGKTERKRPVASRGDSLTNEPHAPPKTSIFESAGDILHPPLPSQQWIIDPKTRRRTIFHDRVYHPQDIPPPPVKRSGTRILSFGENSSEASVKSVGTDNTSLKTVDSSAPPDSGGMKVEEKIARAYHRDLSWRKVLVRLEPDAHNNMIVRRMFANAYGWPVVKHLCDTHFADTHAATTRDEDEPARERAKPMDAPISSESGEQVHGQTDKKVKPRTRSETREARDELATLNAAREGAGSSFSSRKTLTRQESAVWDDSYFETSDGEDSDTVDERNLVARIINPNPAPLRKAEQSYHRQQQYSSSPEEPRAPTTKTTAVSYTDGHRGLAPTSPTSPKSFKEVKARAPSSKVGSPTFEAGDVEPVVADRLVEEPTPLSPASPGSVLTPGLRKSVEEQIQTGSPSRKKSKGNGSGGLSGSPD
ncbi:Putative lipase ROG1 [Fulvia fulva]|uniref:Lipase ROG1 n=1 Tax=Passalora fulva TaxID=5499 RepID=A0A9Q8URH4_PASFU|nr:Putative lipase ROG1 [Fulvia fulva]KAK4620853.1 putative lipase ROG1 [Fulvia fulva]UJO19809.1 Putative lipase ROG1 [Fulvia fulva]